MGLPKFFKSGIFIGLVCFAAGFCSMYFIKRYFDNIEYQKYLQSGLNKQGTIVRIIKTGNKPNKFTFDLKAYLDYKKRLRPRKTIENLRQYTLLNGETIDNVLGGLGIPTENKEADAQRIVDFVHSFVYQSDIDNYVKIPLETIIEGGGDCEDLSVLAGALMHKRGIDIVYVHARVRNPITGRTGSHVMPGVAGDFRGETISYKNKIYYLAETTGTDHPDTPAVFRIGEFPFEKPYKVLGIYGMD